MLALMMITWWPSLRARRMMAKPSSRRTDWQSWAKRVQRSLNSSIPIPLKNQEKTRCFAFQLG